MATSKLQRKMSQELSYYFGGYIIRENVRPDWLDYLELDFWIEELDIAIEVQGEQHYKYSSLFHDSPNGFKEQVERDKKKRVVCGKRGIRLFEVASDSEIKQVIDNILLMLPKPESDKIFVEKLKEQNNNTPLSRRRKVAEKEARKAGKITRQLKPILRAWRKRRSKGLYKESVKYREKIEKIVEDNPGIPQVETQLKLYGFAVGDKEKKPVKLTEEEPKAESIGLALHIGGELGETDSKIITRIAKLIDKYGQVYILSKFREAQQVESEGGLMTLDNSRRRTPGGVFFWLIFLGEKPEKANALSKR